MLEESHHYFQKASDVLDLSQNLREILLAPFRVVKVEIVTEADNGDLQHHMGYRVQHNKIPWSSQGGLALSSDDGRRTCHRAG